MSRRLRRLVLSAMLALAALALLPAGLSAVEDRAARPASSTSLSFTISLSPVVSSLAEPVFLTHAGDGSGRLFVVEQAGKIRVVKNGQLLTAAYLDITGLVLCCGERGLLSVAFDPAYASNGTFYVNYTRKPDGDTVVARYVVSNPAGDVANVSSVTPILTIDQPQSNHNGGQLQFGPKDGYLYIGMGDGGGGGDDDAGHDPNVGNGQAPGVLLGKLLRIDVRGALTYTIPASNPFTRTLGYRPEIWALGMRNPWRFSFDRANGDLYIGDVGQNCYEEVSFQPRNSSGGLNFGWRLMEGLHRFDRSNPSDCNQPLIQPVTLTLPIVDYGRSLGTTVAGGYVYRGQDYPWLSGVYFFGDFGSGRIWAVEQISAGVWQSAEKLNTPYNISSFGEDESGELYVVDYGGTIYRIVSTAPADLSASYKSASNPAPKSGDVVTYTIAVRNSGGALGDTVRVTDTIPAGLSYRAGSLQATLGSADDSLAPVLRWAGVLSTTRAVTITYAVDVVAATPQAIQNTVTIDPGFDAPFTRSAIVLVNGLRMYLPLVLKSF